ncbi:hypothetical protein DW614_RS13815 [Enterococcus hirae]
MSNSKINIKLFLLDRYKSLKKVEEKILIKMYKEPLLIAKKDREQASTMTEQEKTFYYNWTEVKKEKITFVETESETIAKEILEAHAELEYPKLRKKDSQGMILPKKDRVQDTSIKVIFFEMEGSIYLLIFTSNEAHTDRVQKLIGQNLIKEVDEKYQIESDLFNWLFYRYSVFKGELSNELIVKNISGFTGNSIDEHNVFKSSSDQTSDLIVTKAFISNGEMLKNVTTRINNTEGEFVFSIDQNSNVSLFVRQSFIYFNSGDLDTTLPVYLYNVLIPAIKEIYIEHSKEFLGIEKKQFSVKIGLEVIQSIMKKNNIELEDIQTSISEKELTALR